MGGTARRSPPLTLPALIGLVVLAWLLAGLPQRLLYFPERMPAPQLFAAAAQAGFQPWPTPESYRGLLRQPRATNGTGVVVLFHGNAGQAGDRVWYREAFERRGLPLLLAEYPGYGARDGRPGESALVGDAVATLREAHAKFGDPLIVVGESLGAAVAVAAASRVVQVRGLLLITPWDTLANVARHHYPWLPVSMLSVERYDSAGTLAGFGGRVAVVVAGADQIVPTALGRELFAAHRGVKRLWEIPRAGHNDWMDAIDPVGWNDMLDFLILPAVAAPA